MEKLFNFIQSLPKALQIAIVVALFFLIGFGVVKFAFGDKIGKATAEEQPKTVILDVPDATEDNTIMSKMEEMRRSSGSSQSTANSYWESLAGRHGDESDGGLMPEGGSRQQAGKERDYYVNGEYLDPTVYSELERYYIKNGIYTKEDVDRRHDEDRRVQEEIDAELERQRLEREERSKRYSDSANIATLEKAFEIASRYNTTQDAQQEEEPEATEPEPRKIDLQQPAPMIRSTVLSDDGIITSLDSDSNVSRAVDEDGFPVVSPAKATFLKSEKLVSGQRVIMRLMQDLTLSDGTVIPSNTHISGTCKIGTRLNIEINTINYGGRIYYANLNIYDNDGTEGIYCPVIVDDKAKKSVKNIGKQAGQAAAGVLGTVFSVSTPYAARVASSGINDIVQSIDSNGNVSVAVSAGYEFYMFENVKN